MNKIESNSPLYIKHFSLIIYALALTGILFVLTGGIIAQSWFQAGANSIFQNNREHIHDLLFHSKFIFINIGIFFFLISFIISKVKLAEFTRIELIIFIFIFLTLILYLISSQIMFFDNDEYEHLHKAWMILKGTIPYYSVHFTHSPSLEWIIAGFMKIQNESIIIIQTMRSVMFMISCASLWLVYLIADKLFKSRLHGFISVFLIICTSAWLFKSPEIRPDNIMVFFALLSFLILIKYYENPKTYYIFLFFVCAILSFIGKQNAAVFYFSLFIALSFNFMLSDRSIRFKITVISLFLMFGAFAFIMIPHRVLLSLGFWNLIPNRNKFWPFEFLGVVLLFSPIAIGCSIIQLFSVRQLRIKHPIVKAYLISIILVCFLFLFLMNKPWLQEMIVMTIFICIFGSDRLIRILKKFNFTKSISIFLIIAAPAYICLFIKITAYKDPSIPRMIFPPMNSFIEDFKTTQAILKISEKNDLVFDAYGKAIFRHHPLDPNFIQFHPENFKRLDALKKSKTKFLIKDKYYYPRFPKETLDWFEETFVPVEEDPYIFIRKK